MPSFTKESLELLRQRIDLLEVLSPYVKFSRSGSSYKALCPFHDEKTPSFIIQASDSHYHCYGCGAHGDAISFLMNHQKMSFAESVESLSEKFQIDIQTTETPQENKGPSKSVLKDALDKAAAFYHYLLLHTEEGQIALSYLYERGFDLDFIKKFQLGFSSKNPYLFQKFMHEKKINKEVLTQAGLIKIISTNNIKDFFSDRIMIPIRDPIGAVIGFSARKFKEETYGGKYVNTSETYLFKKSKVLFGLNYSRKRIAKERKAIIVEGQLDALRLINLGFNITVASQGTAFTEDQAKELIHLGVNSVYLALDSDKAGIEAAIKIGHMFQKEAVEAYVLEIPEGLDPDSILIEQGPKAFILLLQKSLDYLSFLVKIFSKKINMKSPSGKNELVQTIVKKIREWDHPLMVHESLRKLAKLTHTPEDVIGVDQTSLPNIYIKKQSSVTFSRVNPDLVLETDLLRLLFLMGESNKTLVEISEKNLKEEDFKITTTRHLFSKYMEAFRENKPKDLLSFAIDLENTEARLFLSEMLQKKINPERVQENFLKTIQQILDRNWMEKREEIKVKIHSGKCSEEDVIELAKAFDEIKKKRPVVILD